MGVDGKAGAAHWAGNQALNNGAKLGHIIHVSFMAHHSLGEGIMCNDVGKDYCSTQN